MTMSNNPDAIEEEKPRPLVEGEQAARKEQFHDALASASLVPKGRGLVCPSLVDIDHGRIRSGSAGLHVRVSGI